MIGLQLVALLCAIGAHAQTGNTVDESDSSEVELMDSLGDRRRQCASGIQAAQLVRVPDNMQFYRKIKLTRGDAKTCLTLCYERSNFCRSVLYVPTSQVCHFSYWNKKDECEKRQNQLLRPHNMYILACIQCEHSVDLVSTQRYRTLFGLDPPPRRATPFAPTKGGRTPRVANDIWTKDELTVKPNPGFKAQMPKCSGRIELSTYPIINTASFQSYVKFHAFSYMDCAHICWRQHFCVSALYHQQKCLLSPYRGVCTDGYVSPLYRGPVLISCLSCSL